MSYEKIKGTGRLVPTRPTGVEYKVEFKMRITIGERQHGRTSQPATPNQWTECSVRSPHAHRIPDGDYFLHPDDGKVTQMKSVACKWQFLAIA
jgi:hypothetical protein